MAANVRLAQSRDLDAIEKIENDADRLLIDKLKPDDWAAAPTGAARASEPGFILVVEAAKNQAQKRGYRRISLRTYSDVPWNAPFYATAGFVEEEPVTRFHRSLVGIEAELGLDRYGRRVQMVAHTEAPRP